MAKQIALVTVFLSTLVITAAYASGFLPGGAPAWAPWALAVGTAAMLVAMMALGAARGGKIGSLVVPFAFVFLVLAGGFGLVLALPGVDPVNPDLWLGLPPRAAIVLFGIGLLPLFAVPIAYALTFENQTLSAEDLARLRAATRAVQRPVVEELTPVVVEAGEPR